MVKRLIDYISPLFSSSLHHSRAASMQGAAHTNFVTSDTPGRCSGYGDGVDLNLNTHYS
jgi:hypothetical protein